MKVFVTGGSGKLGSRIVKLLVARGDEVIGLGRNEASAAKVKALGATAIQGSLTDVALMKSEASKVDAVIHTAFQHEDFRTDIQRVCAEDRACIQALCDGLNESKSDKKKAFMYTSGTFGTMGPLETDKKEENKFSPRWMSENLTCDLANDHLRTLVVRLAPVVHSIDQVHPFLDFMVPSAKKNGFVGYVDEQVVWPAAHYDDVANLCVLALDKSTPHPAVHAVAEEGVSTKLLAEWVASQLGLSTQIVPQSEAMEKLGFMGALLGMNNPTSNKLTREWLGWTPQGPSLMADLKNLSLQV